MLIVFEGPDSVGKSTISEAFVAHLARERSVPVRRWSFPGRQEGTLGHLVYRLHHDPLELGVTALTPTSRQLLHIAAHVDAIEARILPALGAGEIVVLDRFWWSTMVYGTIAAATADALAAMVEVELKAWGGMRPTVAFLIDRDMPFLLRSDERLADWKRLRVEYKALANRQATEHPVVRIVNDRDVEHAARLALAAVSEHSANSGSSSK